MQSVDTPWQLKEDQLSTQTLLRAHPGNVDTKKGGQTYVVQRPNQNVNLTPWTRFHLDLHVTFTAMEFKSINLHFYHPSSRKRFSLLKRGDQQECRTEGTSLLDNISAARNSCIPFPPSPSTSGHPFRKTRE